MILSCSHQALTGKQAATLLHSTGESEVTEIWENMLHDEYKELPKWI